MIFYRMESVEDDSGFKDYPTKSEDDTVRAMELEENDDTEEIIDDISINEMF